MSFSERASAIISQMKAETPKMGDIKKIAKTIKKDHELGEELWKTGLYHPRLLATLILDKKHLTQEYIDKIIDDIQKYEQKEQHQIMDWLFANQLTKSKKTIGLVESWEKHSEEGLRRLFWYYQSRLRWMGKTNHANTEYLVAQLEKSMEAEAPQVQWMMNFTAAWIGIFEQPYRERLISLGEKLALYKDEVVPKGCTPAYLPEFIRIELEKRVQ